MAKNSARPNWEILRGCQAQRGFLELGPVSHRADEELVYVDVQDAVLDVPLAEPEDARDPVPIDPLEASPLLATLGFQRVKQVYERWLVNMSHAVTLYQGRFF